MRPRPKELLGHIVLIFLLMCVSGVCYLVRKAVWERYLTLGFMLGFTQVIFALAAIAVFVHWGWIGFRRDAKSVQKFFSN